MLTFIKKFLGIFELPDETQQLILKYFPLIVSFYFIFGLGNSFIILVYLDRFGFGTASFLMAVVYLSQFLTDYPTGSLADYIGQRFVIAFAMVFLSIGVFIISLSDSFEMFFIASVSIGIAAGQMSGSFESYLDNNYKISMKEIDIDRKIYGFMYQRISTIAAFVMALSFIIGGIISTYFARSTVFILQGFLSLLFIPIIITFLKDITTDDDSIELPRKEGYFYHFKGGFSFLFSLKENFYLFVGLAIGIASSGVWSSLILFPLYFGYTGSDAGVGSLRAFIFIIGSVLIIFMAKFHKKISNEKLGLMTFLYFVSFYLSAALLLTFIPITNSINIIGMTGVILIMTFSLNTIGAFYSTLAQRVLSVTVPSDKRNSIYSLLPSIGLILQIPLLPVVGYIVEFHGLASGVIILLFIGIISSGFIFLFHHTNKQKYGALNPKKSVQSPVSLPEISD